MLQDIYQAQKQAFMQNPYLSYAERKRNLKLLRASLLANKEVLAAAVCEDFGCRSTNETLIAEILPTIQELNHTLKYLKKWMRPSARHISIVHRLARGKVIYQPLGIVGIIVPWNYPIFLSMAPLIGALAAGNRAMIKMSRNTTKTAHALRNIISKIYPPDYVALICGEEDQDYSCNKLPFDHIIFTGGTETGRMVMKAASDNLTPVTLELGGKSPVLIHESFPLEEAARRIVFGKTLNSGQTCVAPDYILCPKAQVESLVRFIQERFNEYFPTIADNPDYTSVVNEKEHAKLLRFLEDARQKGAQITCCAKNSDTPERLKHKLPLHLLCNCTEDMLVLQKEIFGPLLPIIPYGELTEAIEYIKKRPRPLALYYFDTNSSRIDYVMKQTHSGGVCINDTVLHVAQSDLPFGGIGASGIGQYHGHEGFLAFSKAKAVFTRPSWFNSCQYAYPPYGTWFHRLLYKCFIR